MCVGAPNPEMLFKNCNISVHILQVINVPDENIC